ncbi:MAG: LicD family protein [Clostridia bacterium]|nr:LicD family protein [Clostridia bacterium]
MKELNKEELKNVQLEILKYINTICKENNITYYIFFGTLIGAVRHKGFIPWDDDVDICIKREEYNRFIKVVQKDKKYNLISFETDPNYYFPFARVSDKKTQLVLKNIRDINNFGVFVDVFIIDNAPNEDEFEEWYKKYQKLNKKVRMTVPTKIKKTSFRGKLSRIKHFPERIFYGVKNFSKYTNELNELITKYNSIETEKCMVAYGTKEIFNKRDFKDTVELNFENIKVSAPIGYDQILRQIYGNYMELPPEDKRASHHHFTAYWK